LHQDYHLHEQAMKELVRRAEVISQIEAGRIKADGTTQERNTLLYESEQFRVQELWHMASPPRQKVLDLREKVFGTGGRRMPNGVHGALGGSIVFNGPLMAARDWLMCLVARKVK